MNDPEAGLGLHQLGGWHCQCNFGLRKASPPSDRPIRPKHLPFLLPGVLLLCADATQSFPERPWGWVEAASARGKGPAVACMETQSRMQCLIPVHK